MSTVQIHIEGRVQGVGFRPHVFRLARKYGMNGWVNNGLNGVHIVLSNEEKKIQKFYTFLKNNPPPLAVIKKISIREIENISFTDFQITESFSTGKPNLLLTPDFGLCESCRNELWNAHNRRSLYAFTTCLQCGPRYSIIKQLPYDRQNTTMESFVMCPDCEEEYSNPENRRHFSQTNSCPNCPVHLFWLDAKGAFLSDKSAFIFKEAIAALQNGKILAVKGIGGFLLIVDATNEQSLLRLRERKNRPTKPFALLYSDELSLAEDVWLNEQEIAAWKSIESPIVLFKLKENPASGIKTNRIAPDLDAIGVMRPYTPLLEILAKDFGKPIVATSGNVSGSPIYFEDGFAIKNLGSIADFFLTNDRDIVIPQDDSVVAFSKKNNKKVILRRSRGFAPTFLHDGFFTPDQSFLAMGAMLKSTITLHHEGNTFVSQYLGDSSNYDVQNTYLKVYKHLKNLLQFKPDLIVVDKHPDYFSTRQGKILANQFGVNLLTVQHHEAHFAAVLAENDLLYSNDPVLGVIWDGTGYGDDGQVWGGEFFVFQDNGFNRLAHFDYFKHLLGDKMAKEPRLSALSLCFNLPGCVELLKPKFTSTEWLVYEKYLSKENMLQTSSVGRLFDGAASLLNICDKQSFEGEAAMQLQVLAQQYCDSSNDYVTAYPLTKPSPRQLIKEILRDIKKGTPHGLIALKFHLSLVKIIRQTAEDLSAKKIAFSGGVFQNTLLVDLLIAELQNDFDLFFHQNLSPNDENISFGQLAVAALHAGYFS